MTGRHPGNPGPMLGAARCGARTRSGGACQAPAVRGKARCRMHGGASGSGAPIGNRNALKHGLYARGAVERRRAVAGLIREARRMLGDG